MMYITELFLTMWAGTHTEIENELVIIVYVVK